MNEDKTAPGKAAKESAETADTVIPAGSSPIEAAAAKGARPHHERVGAQIGRYKLLEQIGEGGFGTVWAAEQREPVKRRVALKVIKLGMDTRQVIARFEAERQALAMMDHPNIAKVLDAGETETGRPYFVMELVKGVPILEYCDQEKQDTRARLDLFMKVCHAIQHAHQKGIIHRDIKPSNVLVTLHDGTPVPKVIDFGIAKATNQELTEKTLYTQHRQMIGTPAYMSPEQAEMSGLDIDTRSDVYSLGVLLYELLTGTTPFDSQSLMEAGLSEMMRIIREETPHKPSTRLSSLGETSTRTAQQRQTDVKMLGSVLRGDLDWIVMKCLEKDRTRRYETANGLAADIARHLRDEPVTAGPPSAGYRLRKFVKRNRGQVIAGGVIAAMLVLGIFGTSVGMVWALHEKKEADAARAEALVQQARAIEQETEARKLELEARKQAAIAEAVAKFQTDMLAAVDPNQLPKDPVTGEPLRDGVTVLQAMEGAVRELDAGSLRDQPLVEAGVRNAIGNTLRGLTRYREAEPNLRKSLEILRGSLPAGHPGIAAGLNNLAVLLRDQGRLVEAETLFRESLEITRASRPAGHPDIALALNNLADLLRAQNKLAEAEVLSRQAVGILRAALPAESPDIALALNNLAALLKDQNKSAEAEAAFREALAIRRAALPAEHPDVAVSLNNLAELLRAANRLDEAEPLLREALRIWRASLPAGHRDIAIALVNLAAVYWTQGELEQSIPMLEEALLIQESQHGRRHPDTLFTIANLGVNYASAERFEEAIPLLEEAYRASKSMPSLGWVGQQLLDAYAAAADPAEPESAARAVALLQELMVTARAALPPDSLELAGQFAAFSVTLLTLEKWNEAESLVREALAIRERAEPDAWTTFNTRSMLGGALLGQNKLAEAEPLLLDGFEGMKRREADIAPQARVLRIPEALERLVRLYEAKGDQDEAAVWRARLEEEQSRRDVRPSSPP